MTEPGKYIPSSFQAMIVPRQKQCDLSDVVPQFSAVAGEPGVVVESKSFVACLKASAGASVASDEAAGLVVAVHGEIYGDGLKDGSGYVLRQYQACGVDFAKDINGSFVILIVDKRNDAFYAITDRLNTRDILHSERNGAHWFSSTLGLHPVADVPIDMVGLGCFLATGAVLNNRTLFEGVRILDRGSIYRLNGNALSHSYYWEHRYTNEYQGVDEAKLRRELADIITESVRVRMVDETKTFVSLSGGYDSATILAVMMGLGKTDVDCHSYTYGTLKPETDAGVAQQMAAFLGCSYKVGQSYTGDLAGIIKANADWGCGMNKFCEDALVWQELSGMFAKAMPCSIFVGDECFGDVPFLRSSEIRTMDDMLECVGIHDFTRLDWLSKYVPKKIFTALREGWMDERATIVGHCPKSDDVRDYKDYLYLDQRINHIICSWRHHIMGQHVTVRQPLLDNNIVGFVSKLPSEMRLFKRLYVDTVVEMFPDLFKIKICRATPGSYPRWGKEFADHRADLAPLLSGVSRLDSVVPPQAITHLLDANSRLQGDGLFTKPYKFMRRVRKSHKLYSITKHLPFIQPDGPDHEVVEEVALLQRMLVLRSMMLDN